MHAAVVVFPGSNCDRDLAVAFKAAGAKVSMVWHKDSELPQGVDMVGIPGGFSYGDYLRCGAIAANSPICRSVAAHGVPPEWMSKLRTFITLHHLLLFHF